ncbi:MAG: DUF11 domain-containing protein, partial [Candidatus Eisenbacteria bacterium]
MGAVQLVSQVFTLSEVRQSLSSNANKVDVLVAGPDPGTLGGTITITVEGRTGNVSPGDILDLTAASYDDWPADQLELYSMSVTFNDIAGSTCGSTVLGTFTDQLAISWGQAACYTVVYKLRVRGFTSGPTLTSPLIHAVSGSQYKHTDPGSLSALTPVSVTTANVRLVKTAIPVSLPLGGTSTYKLHIINSGSNASCPVGDATCNDVLMDDFVDNLPTSPGSATYVAGTSKLDGVAFADPVISGSTLTWLVNFSVPAGGARDLTYDVSFPGSPSGSYTNSAVGHIGTAQVDTTASTGDNRPGKASVAVGTVADLSLSKSGPATVNALGSITYTIVVGNHGPTVALAVVVRDTLPAGVTFVSANNGGTASSGVVTWPAVATLANGDSITRTVTVTAPVAGTLVNVARANTSSADPDSTNNNGSAAANRVTTTVTALADLSLSKTGPATVDAAQNLTYTIVVDNNGPSNAASVVVRDTLPAGVTFVSADNGGTASNGVVTWPAVASLANGGSIMRSVTVTAPATGTLVNVARANAATADPDTTNNNGSAAANRVTTTVTELADLSLAKSGPATVNAASNFSYTILTTNNGPSGAASVVVQDTLPAGVTFVAADNGGAESGGVVTWPAVASLANGGSITRTVTVTAPATGTLLNLARADATTADPDTTNNNGAAAANRVTTTVTELADLAVSKTGPATVNALGSITYTILTTNNGPSTASSVTFVSADNGGTESGGIVTWPVVAAIANGGSVTRSVTVTAPVTGALTNVARADGTNADPDTTNNNGTAAANRVTTTVTELADLALSKSGPAAVDAAQNLTYTIVTTNNGPSDAAGVVVQDTLPAGVTFVSADNGGTETGGVVTWPAAASIANGGNVTYTVTVTAPATGMLLNVARADAATTDPDTTNNNGAAPANQATTIVNQLADVSVSKTGPATVDAAQNLTYTIVVTNNGPSTASNVVAQDTLPQAVTFVSANGGSVTYSVTVTAPTTGTLTNVARADGSIADPDTTNNNGSAAANRVTTTVAEVADLSLVKNGPATVDAAQNLTYTLTVENQGPSSATNVVVQDSLPK